MEKRTMATTVNSVNEVQDKVSQFMREGYNKDRIYVLAHDEKTTDFVSDRTNTSQVGTSEEGVLNTVANVFRSRGDQLRAKMESLDVSSSEAQRLEKEMDNGKIVVLACQDTRM
jgi:hypothetical protein